jgi:hypothetical protein
MNITEQRECAAKHNQQDRRKMSLLDCIEELKIGRPPVDQRYLDMVITNLKLNPEVGKPFS